MFLKCMFVEVASFFKAKTKGKKVLLGNKIGLKTIGFKEVSPVCIGGSVISDC